MPSFDSRERYKDILKNLPAWFPLERHTPEDTFEFALSLAGAISGGAYTAGFMDFLFQALDEWHSHQGEKNIPEHRVRLKTITGASAGSIVAALSAFAIRHQFPYGSAPDQAQAGRLDDNPFYRAWVKEIDICKLLAEDDLAQGEVKSLLNSQPLESIAKDLRNLFRQLPVHPESKVREWAGASFSVHFSLSNLCGVPYSLSFRGERDGHLMRMHRDYVSFAVPVFKQVEGEDYPPNYRVLSKSYDDEVWETLLKSALASGAFPAAFSARELKRPSSDYDWLFVGYEKPASNQGAGNGTGYHFAEPLWDKDKKAGHSPESGDYYFLAADGGAMNNEPFDIAHRILAGLCGQNPRGAMEARRAVIMVDPFPELPKLGIKLERGKNLSRPMIQTLLALITGWKNNSRFKTEDLFLASADEVYSRYLVVPKRRAKQPALNFTAAGMGGFLALFEESYRHYDFFLGRLNAYKFLRDWFVLPHHHPLFNHSGMDKEDMKNLYRSHEDTNCLQIIPLVGSAAKIQENQQYLPPWPREKFTDRKLDELRELIDRRVSKLLPLIAQEASDAIPLKRFKWLVWGAGKLVPVLGRKKLVDFIMDQIKQARDQVDEDVYP